MRQTKYFDSKIVAIIRGVTPDDVVAVGQVLLDAGIRAIEVPLNSPQPFKSIELLAKVYGDSALIGAGTVLTRADADRVHAAGGRLVVSPNTNEEVIRATKGLGMLSMPGFATATEAFAAIDAGADALKLFPAGPGGPAALAALKAVLPPHMPVFAVGGVGPHNMASFVKAGADGFGLGSNLYKPDFSLADITENARSSVAAATAAFT